MTENEKQAEKQGHTPTPWVVDECDDANGFSTIRIADGSVCGDTEAQPIGTIYNYANADLIVEAVNNHARLLAENAALREEVAQLSASHTLVVAEAAALRGALIKLEEHAKHYVGLDVGLDNFKHQCSKYLEECLRVARLALAGGKA